MTIDRRDLVEQITFLGLARDNRTLLRFSPRDQRREIGHHVGTELLGTLMTAETVPTEDRLDIVVVTDRRLRAGVVVGAFVNGGLLGRTQRNRKDGHSDDTPETREVCDLHLITPCTVESDSGKMIRVKLAPSVVWLPRKRCS